MRPTVPVSDELHETKTSQFKIIVGTTPLESRVELNGQPIEGVRRVSFDLDANKPSASCLRLEIIGEAIVEGEYVERLISASEGTAKQSPIVTLGVDGFMVNGIRVPPEGQSAQCLCSEPESACRRGGGGVKAQGVTGP